MTKLIAMLVRKPGMSFEDFRAYYEERHVPLIQELNPWMSDYRRSYVDFSTVTGGMTAATDWQPDFDVITEVWFRDRETFEKSKAALTVPETAERIAADEARFLDRGRKRMFLADECGPGRVED